MKFISGNRFKEKCNFSFNGEVLKKESSCVWDYQRIFIKTDFISQFFNRFRLTRPTIIVTHNSDYGVGGECLQHLNNPLIVKWYAQNVLTNHPKLFSIPIGIANEEWPHGNTDQLNNIIRQNIKKSNLIYANFNINTNIKERSFCLDCINKKGINLAAPKAFAPYLQELAASYFTISPNENGIDCHKTWEALYLKTIPIVTDSINVRFYKNLPIEIISDWSKFDPLKYTEKYYRKKWQNFTIEQLDFINYESILYA